MTSVHATYKQMKRNDMEHMCSAGLPYLSLFEEVQGNLDVLQSVETHAALFSGLKRSETERK